MFSVGCGGGLVFLRNMHFNQNLRPAGWHRSGHNDVTADYKKGPMAHWFIEAALPLNPAPPVHLTQVSSASFPTSLTLPWSGLGFLQLVIQSFPWA